MRPYLGPKHTVNGDVIMIIDFRAKQMMMMIEMIIDFEAEQSMGLISHRIRVDPLLGIYLMLPSVLPTSLVFSIVSFCPLFLAIKSDQDRFLNIRRGFVCHNCSANTSLAGTC